MSRTDDYDDDRPRRRRPPDDDFDDRPRPKKSNTGLVIGILVGVFVLCCGGGGVLGYLFFMGAKEGFNKAMETAQGAMEAEESRVNLTQIGNAIENHHNAMQAFPNNSYETRGKQSRPLLSWRVHLLPYLNEQALYRQFKLDEPWDSPNNRPLVARMPAVYGTPQARARAGEGRTFYRGFSGPNGIFAKPQFPGAPAQMTRLADVTDGTSNTLLVIDSDEAIEWTRPDDLDFSPGRPRPKLGGAYPNYPFIMVLMADGMVKEMNREVPDETLRLLIDRMDGRAIPPGWDLK